MQMGTPTGMNRRRLWLQPTSLDSWRQLPRASDGGMILWQRSSATAAQAGSGAQDSPGFCNNGSLSCQDRVTHGCPVSSASVPLAGFGPGWPCMARLVANERLTAQDHFQDTRHVEFALGLDGPRYDPGDILTVFPRQDQSAVSQLLHLLGLDADARIRIDLADAASTSGKHTAEASSMGWCPLSGA